jgi:hypothetical protein
VALLMVIDRIRPTRGGTEYLSVSSSPRVRALTSDLPLFNQLPQAEPSDVPAVNEAIPAMTKAIPSAKVTRRDSAKPRSSVRAIQDLILKEALLSLPWSEQFGDVGTFQNYMREHLHQNSLSTRDRYAQTLIRWFYADGMKGLVSLVWRQYHDLAIAEEILRYRYLEAETMVGQVVADALFPISENALIPESYLPHFLAERFGPDISAKTVERLKSNLRKLGFLAYGKDHRDVLRLLNPTATSFLIVLHHQFALDRPASVEFRTLAADPFWKYLGFKSEDRLRAILRDGLDRGLIAKYVVADRIESISLQYSFHEFVDGRMQL